MRMRHGLGALALACAAWGGPALADSQGRATMGGLGFTLFDLDLTDSVTPSLTWSIPDAPSGLMSPGSVTVAYSVTDEQVSDSYLDHRQALPGMPARLSFSPGPQASVDSALAHPGTLAQVLSVSAQIASGGQRDAFTTGEVFSDRYGFTLSPNTRVAFTVDLAFTASTQQIADYGGLIEAYGAIYVNAHAPLGGGDSDATLMHTGTLEGSPLELDQTVGLSVDFSNATPEAAYGDVYFLLLSQARSWPVSPVPEPASWVMLSFGAILLGWRRLGAGHGAKAIAPPKRATPA